jgi:hypothetical protein
MGVNQLKYQQKYEELRKKGVPTEEAHQQAVDYASKVTKEVRKALAPKPKGKLAKAMVWASRKGRELRHGKKTYLYETPEERRERVEKEK